MRPSCRESQFTLAKAPILDNKQIASPSVFAASALLREARRQKCLPTLDAPNICILDPDGDLVRQLRQSGAAKPFPAWPCYHTDLDVFELAGRTVGAPFAVLVAEQLFASNCSLLISLTSAGQIVPVGVPPYFVVIDRALRDEGTSYHYAEPSEFAEANPALVQRAAASLAERSLAGFVGASWTTDAPYRETAESIVAASEKGILAVEMEAAALYAFAHSTGAGVLCLAHVTNTMAQTGDDFEKGEADGTTDALAVLEAVILALA